MSTLRDLGDFMFDDEGPNFFGTVGLAALMTWSFQGAIDDNDWDMGTENSEQSVQKYNQKMAEFSTVGTDYRADKSRIEVEQKELDLLKDLDENRNGEWAYDSEETKDHMWSDHLLSNKSNILKKDFNKVSSALEDDMKINLLTNMDISEQRYIELSDAFDNKTGEDLSQYGVMLRECQIEYMDNAGLSSSEKADEINGCMSWENTKDVLDWAVFFPFLLLGGLGMFAGKAGLYGVDKAVQKNANKPKKKDIKPN